MLEFFRTYQVYILIACSLNTALLAFFVSIIKFHSTRNKFALLKIELSASVLLMSDAIAFIHKGDTSKFGWNMTRVTNFLVFIFTLLSIYFLNGYVTSLYMGSGKFKKLPKRLLLGYILPLVGCALVVISQFNNMYYYFNENNIYQRGPLYPLSFIIPFFSLFLLFTFMVQYKRVIKRRLFLSAVFFSVTPFIAAILQVFMQGLALIDFATWQSAVTLFWFVLIDQNSELLTAANTELKSGLPNTYGFMYEVDRIAHFQDITEYSGFYFDICRMIQINNKFGREIGDEIIIEYGRKIRDSLDKDELLSRLGGNYFAALVKKSNVDKFLELLRDVPVQIKINGKLETVHVAAVAGGYKITEKKISAGQILGYTSTAVVYAKTVAHKPCVYMDDELKRELLRIRTLEEETKIGIEKKEFVPFYQPKFDSRGNKLIGAEALARWKHNGKLVPPMEFVPIMEKNGSICDLDFYILHQVCQDIKTWLENGIEPVTVSVNFSRKNLGNPILAEAISKVVESYDIPKGYVQIEVTETIDEFPLDYLIGVVEALQRYGLTVAIDDFGAGSSSIMLLKKVDFDVLKIDKVLVDYKDDREKQLLGDVISMAKNIGIRVIAEGVEEANQVHELARMGCFLIQGYVYSKPVEKEAFEKYLDKML